MRLWRPGEIRLHSTLDSRGGPPLAACDIRRVKPAEQVLRPGSFGKMRCDDFGTRDRLRMLAVMKKRLRTTTKQAMLQVHEAGSRLGVFVLPKHYYVPLPDLRELRRTREKWARRSEMRGVRVDLDEQLRTLDQLVRPFGPEYRDNTAYNSAVAGHFGPGFGAIEAQALHGFLRGTKPRRIIEVGSGVSTFCMEEAIGRNASEGSPASLTCIEPYPSAWLRQASVSLVQQRVEDVALDLFGTLEAGDFLFVDSTHALKVGGDVLQIILEVLPRLQPGVHVHFHDIYFPFDYQRDADRSIFQWLETAMLHAYLVGNQNIDILFCLSQLHYDRPDALRAVFPSYRPEAGADGLKPEAEPTGTHFPSSLYLRTR